MIPLILGTDLETKRNIVLDPDLFRTHFHLLGSTGAGKTTAIHTMLHPILMNARQKSALFVIDPMGGLSEDLLRFMASKRHCPDHVRKRLLYIQPSLEEIVLPFNPLLHDTPAHQYYKVTRTVDLILRAWESQDIMQMPRLATWTYNSFAAAAEMGYPLAICKYLLHPGSPEHEALLMRLPEELQYQWGELFRASGQEALRLLESTRNRIGPFFRSPILARMFGSRENHFNVEQFIRDRRIVIVNVASYNRLDSHIGSAIGGLILNEIFSAAANLSRHRVDPTYVLLDEFQKFVGPDLCDAIPTFRQKGLRLILAHQSFSQLIRGDVDLTGIIWQARSRLMFANDAEDADTLAHELATIDFDPYKIKDVRISQKQRIAGYRREWLKATGRSSSLGDFWGRQSGKNDAHSSSSMLPPGKILPFQTTGFNFGSSTGDSFGGSAQFGESEGEHEVNVPIHEDFEEVSNITFMNFAEQRTIWAKAIRLLKTGEAFGKFVNDPRLYPIAIKYRPIMNSPAIEEARLKLLEENFAGEEFRSAAEMDREAEEIRLELLKPPRIESRSKQDPSSQDSSMTMPSESSDKDPFRDA